MLSSTLLGPARALRGALPRAAFAAPALALHPRQPSAPLALAGTARPAAASAASAQTYRRNLDINAGVCKEYETASLPTIRSAPVTALQGIGPQSADALEKALGVKSVEDLATNRFLKMARAIVTLAAVSDGQRDDASVLDIDGAVMAKFEAEPLDVIANAPVHALQGLTEEKAEHLKVLGVLSVRDLGELKFFAWAEAVATLAPYARHGEGS